MIKLFISLSFYFWVCLILAVFSGPIVLANIEEASEESFGKVVVSDPKSDFEAEAPILLKVISDNVVIAEESVTEEGSEETKDYPSSEDEGIVIVEETQSESPESQDEAPVTLSARSKRKEKNEADNLAISGARGVAGMSWASTLLNSEPGNCPVCLSLYQPYILSTNSCR